MPVIEWKYFSLEQVNRPPGNGRKVWELPEDASSGLRPFRAAEAARRQGDTAFTAFHYALLAAGHVEGLDIQDRDVIDRVARGAGLDMARFREDFQSPRALVRLAEHHTFAVETLGIFGTPTLVFPRGRAVFLKMAPPPSPKESPAVFAELSLLASRRNILEVKRPAP